jgi:hypothetical protein
MLRVADRFRQRDGPDRRLSPPGGGTRVLPHPRRPPDSGLVATKSDPGPATRRRQQRLANGRADLDRPRRRFRLWQR